MTVRELGGGRHALLHKPLFLLTHDTIQEHENNQLARRFTRFHGCPEFINEDRY